MRRRRISFFYDVEGDIRNRGAKTRRIRLSGLPDADALREEIRRAAGRSSRPAGFVPFLRTEADGAFAEDDPEWRIGWDFSFELDLDLRGSFRALLPLAAAFEHYGIPTLVKYSGHRSLHVTLPAEAFNEAGPADHARWMARFDLLGGLLCRLVPRLDTTLAGLAKHTPLTTPYSLHRYHGRVSLPLSLSQALAFDPDDARLDRFAGVAWDPGDLRCDGAGAARLLDLARQAQERPEAALDAARAIFAGERWAAFAAEEAPAEDDRFVLMLMAGAPAIGLARDMLHDDREASRWERALLRLDDPGLKGLRAERLFGPVTFSGGSLAGRLERSRILSLWAHQGTETALDQLRYRANPWPMEPLAIARAVHLARLLPERADYIARLLADAWDDQRRIGHRALLRSPFPPSGPTLIMPERLAVALMIAERSHALPSVLDRFAGAGDPDRRKVLRACLTESAWDVVEAPDRAVMAIELAFGRVAVRGCLEKPDSPLASLVVSGVFGDRAKFEHAARSVSGYG